MNKKIVAVLITILMVIALVGCGKSASDTKNTEQVSQAGTAGTVVVTGAEADATAVASQAQADEKVQVNGNVTVDGNKLFNIASVGANGSGKIDPSMNRKYIEALLLGKDANAEISDEEASENGKKIRANIDATKMVSSFKMVPPSNDGTLSNGDQVELKIEFDPVIAKSLNITVEPTTVNYTVEGLK